MNEGAVIPDEDALVIPDVWRRSLHPRRGGLAVAPVKVPPSAGKKALALVAKAEAAFEALSPDGSDGDLAERARRHLAGDADPAGAAVTALVAALEAKSENAALKTFADAWVVEHGLAFAACAVVELSSIAIARLPEGPWRGTWPAAVRGKDPRRDTHADVLSLDGRGCARRVRTLLACADDAEYERAVGRLADYRDGPGRRLLVSYLVPTRHDWVGQCCAEIPPDRGYWAMSPRPTLFLTLGTAEHLKILGRKGRMGDEINAETIATLVDGLRAGALPVLVGSLRERSYSDSRRRLLDAISVLPTDEAFQTLIDRLPRTDVRSTLLTMMNRFPVRALRMLAGAAVTSGDAESSAAVTGLLERHVVSHPDVVAEASGLPGPSRAVVESVLPSADRVPDAPLDALPPLLVQPPWERPRKAAKPVVIQGLEAPVQAGMAWDEGERESRAASKLPEWWQARSARWTDPDWAALAAKYRDGRLSRSFEGPQLFATGPEEVVRPLLAMEWKGYAYWWHDDLPWLWSVIARYELDALPLALTAVRESPTVFAELLMSFLDGRVAKRMAGWFARTKALRGTAIAWFERHGVQAARLLMPAALGKAGAGRREAEGALLLIASRIGNEPVVDAAREHGDRAADAVADLLSADPLDRLPAKLPKDAEWVVPARLPQVLLRGDEARALPATAIRHLLTMLALSKPGELYPGVEVVREVCAPGSLAEFSWALFQEWERDGAPPQDGWALHQLGWFGDDETARRLTPVLRAWPGEGGHHKAVTGLDVLTAIGSDVALLQLHGISEKVKFKALKARAREKIGEVAAGLGLSAEQLSDRLVPDLGLDADGSMTLDYGPRRFTVGFDEQLKPYVTDEDGKRRKALPKPGAKDDPDLAPAAYKRFADLRKDVRLVAGSQVQRLERAMVTRRRWTPDEFQSLFVEHPLVSHIARRLVWLLETGDGTIAFRVAEDRTLADVGDDSLTLPDEASIGIAHPLDLGDGVAAWSGVLADYEILQPFPQLAREVHALTDEQRASGRLTGFEGITVPAHTVLGLTKRGWERGNPEDNGVERWISKPVPGGLHVVIDLEWGISVGMGADQEDQPLNAVWINDRPGDFWNHEHLRYTFGELDPVTASEVLADLTWLAESKL